MIYVYLLLRFRLANSNRANKARYYNQVEFNIKINNMELYFKYDHVVKYTEMVVIKHTKF